MLGSTIGLYRRKLGMTQEQLAQQLDVTNQAVSKWETDQCCPDVQLLPRLADVLGISLDTLFGRESPKQEPTQSSLPWENDDALHIAVYHGHELIGGIRSDMQECTFHYEGPAKDIYCAINLCCEDVEGNVQAGGYVECGDVGGNVDAGGYVECSDVAGHLNSTSYVECGDVEGNLNAGSYVECGDVGGSVNAVSYVECGDVDGNVTAGSYVECGDIGGGAKGDDPDSGFHFHFNPFKK